MLNWSGISAKFVLRQQLGKDVSRSVYTNSQPLMPSLVIRVSFYLLVQEGHVSHERLLFPTFRETEKRINVLFHQLFLKDL